MPTLFEHLQTLVPWVLLISIRIGTLFALMPSPFGELAPMRIRAALGLTVSLAVTLAHAPLNPHITLDAIALIPAILGEVLMGGVMGLTVRVMLAAAEIAGTLAGHSMGLGFANSVDPTFNEQTLATSSLMTAFATLIFLTLNGHHAALAAFSESVRALPPPIAFHAIRIEAVLQIANSMMAQGLRIAFPVMATMFIVQIGTALVSRIAPRVHIFTLKFGVAVTAGLLTLYVASPSMGTAISTHLRHVSDALRFVLGGS